MKYFSKIFFVASLIFTLSGQSVASEVNVYTSRHYDSDEKIYTDFKNLTGIKVNIISGKGKALMERLRLEGKSSPADVFITSDAGNLWKAEVHNLLTKIGFEQSLNDPCLYIRNRNGCAYM